MSPDGKTHWELPLAVSLELTPDQQDYIRDLLHEFETKTHQMPRATMTVPRSNSFAAVSRPASDEVQCISPCLLSAKESDYVGSDYVQPDSLSLPSKDDPKYARSTDGADTPGRAATKILATAGARASLYPVPCSAVEGSACENKGFNNGGYMVMKGGQCVDLP